MPRNYRLSDLFSALRQAFFTPKSKFYPDQIPDLTGRVMIVTGGNTGLGKETIKVHSHRDLETLRLLIISQTCCFYSSIYSRKLPKSIWASRSKSKAEAAIEELKKETGNEAIFLKLNLANLSSVQKAAQVFLSKERELHVLFNNAGLMWCPVDLVTDDKYDMQFGTNVLGHWYFTELLMPALLAGKATSSDGYARVITLSSSGAYIYTLNWDTFKDGPERRKMSTYNLYFQSKFGNVVVARELARRYADKGILSITLNPGNIRSDLHRYEPKWQQFFGRLFLYSVFQGALTQLYAGTMPEAVQYNGEFLIPWARLGRCREEAYDHETGERLWKWLEEQVKKSKTN
ncbi:NAD(P)-binding protein [Abortiporus biennis]|nr:NAD(P)-binding protein [Abortiporus biennis]